MEGLSSSATSTSLAASPLNHPFHHESIFAAKAHRVRRRLSSLHRTKRARLQPRPRNASMSPSSTQLDPTTGESGRTGPTPAAEISSVPDAARPRRPTVQSDIQETILHPGTVRINVQGAFIVDDEPSTPESDDYTHDPRDIRLPNHTAVVSHIAVDVSLRATSWRYCCKGPLAPRLRPFLPLRMPQGTYANGAIDV